MKHNPFVGLAGNIGVGKTTFTEKIAVALNWTPIYESVSDNPYLNDFYNDMNRWSFNLQIYFLQKRFEAQRNILSSKGGIIVAFIFFANDFPISSLDSLFLS